MKLKMWTTVAVGILCAASTWTSAWSAESKIRFRLHADPVTLDWNLAHTSLETYLIMNLMEGLVEESSEGKPVAALAEKWDVSPDGKTYLFYLRSNVKWSDGTLLSAKDFEESWFRLLSPSLNASYSSFLDEVEGAEQYRRGRTKDRKSVGIRALDAKRFEVKLRRRVPYFLHLATFWVTFPIRADLIKKHGSNWTAPGKLVTLGPYILDSWKKGQVITLKRNETYHASAQIPSGAANLVEAMIEPDDRAAREAFEQGKIDFLLNATTQDLLKSRNQSQTGKRAVQFPYLATYYLGFNTKSISLKDPAIRRAIASVVQVDELPAAMQAGEIVARSWIPPGIEGYDPTVRNRPSRAEAQKILAKAGFVEGRAFPRLSIWIEPFDGAEAAGKKIAASLRTGLGIESDLKFAPLAEMRKAGTPSSLFVGHWGADFADADNMLGVFLKGSGTNYTGWSSDEYDRLISSARSSSDPNERLNSYRAAEKLLLDQDAVILPLFYKKNTVLLGPRVGSFSISPLNYLFLKTVTLQTASPK